MLSHDVVSTGISHNKLLAKLASGMNKPNNQTVIPVSAVAALMGDLALNKIRNFGGKLGHALEALGCVTAADVQKLSQAQLEAAVGDNAAYDSHPTVDCPRDAAVFCIFVPCRFLVCVLVYTCIAAYMGPGRTVVRSEHQTGLCHGTRIEKQAPCSRSDWREITAGL